MPEKNFFRCNVCNDIHHGITGPELCPTCKTENAYVQIDKEEAKNLMQI
jgi:rubrerythrin